MKLTIHPEKLVSAVQKVIGVVERRATLPILSNILCSISDNKMQLTATDFEVEIESFTPCDGLSESSRFTIPAHKFLEISKSLTHDEVEFSYHHQKVTLKTNSACYTLSTLPADDFPNIEEAEPILTFELPQIQLKRLLDKTQYAMANQDVRYYLNGMLWQVADGELHTVAMDGHRFAHAQLTLSEDPSILQQVLVPFRGIVELNRLLEKVDIPISVKFCSNYLWLETDKYRFRCKLIDAAFPDYRFIVRNVGQQVLMIDKLPFKQALSRLGIVVSSQLNAVRMEISPNNMRLSAISQDHDEAWEELTIEYEGDSIVLGFNVQYLLDALAVIDSDRVKVHVEHVDKGVLLEGCYADEHARFVIMPLRL